MKSTNKKCRSVSQNHLARLKWTNYKIILATGENNPPKMQLFSSLHSYAVFWKLSRSINRRGIEENRANSQTKWTMAAMRALQKYGEKELAAVACVSGQMCSNVFWLEIKRMATPRDELKQR